MKPKFQCLMVDPSFSMVTVQSEDSGIVWETASSRCSTPWASETSSISDAYSMEGSGAAGKITIVFDEEKVARRRIRSGGRSSRLADRLSRAGSSRSASALGTERLEMTEVSVPNIAEEKAETEPDLEKIKNKDQQLFSLISEGYEILNIRVPTKLPTVDEEESTELPDNLSYLDQTPRIKSRTQEWSQQQNHVPQEEETPSDQQVVPAFNLREHVFLFFIYFMTVQCSVFNVLCSSFNTIFPHLPYSHCLLTVFSSSRIKSLLSLPSGRRLRKTALTTSTTSRSLPWWMR